MLIHANLFEYFEDLGGEQDGVCWAARTPLRPSEGFDLRLFPRVRGWQDDRASLNALERLEGEPWVAAVTRRDGGVEVRVTDGWIKTAGAALQEGEADEGISDIAGGRRYAVQFWDANATKALHVGHLRNLAVGNALACSLLQAGADVERRSLISDAGRSMGEAMAGVMKSGRLTQAWPDRNEKSDHFVGACYADYVATARASNGNGVEQAGDSLTRELVMHDDDADELLGRVLRGEREALELWYKTRAWVISGQRKTLARLGIPFDRVFFESDYLAEMADLAELGLREGLFQRREDGVVIYPTGREDFDEFPLLRGDDLPTQHMRTTAFWKAAPGLEGITSVQVCGEEWIPHGMCRRQLMAEVLPDGGTGMHPNHEIFHGMVSRQKRAVTSSEGGSLLIDELIERLELQVEAHPHGEQAVRCLGSAERVAAVVALGYFLPRPVSQPIDFSPEFLLDTRDSPGWDIVRARASVPRPKQSEGDLAHDLNYRFVVLQSELHRRHLRLALERLDATALARYVTHFARWYLEAPRSERVRRVAHAVLDRGVRGLGLQGE